MKLDDVVYLIGLITCFSYILMISLDHWNKMVDYLINSPFGPELDEKQKSFIE